MCEKLLYVNSHTVNTYVNNKAYLCVKKTDKFWLYFKNVSNNKSPMKGKEALFNFNVSVNNVP